MQIAENDRVDLTEKLEVGDVIFDFINQRRVKVIELDKTNQFPIAVSALHGRGKILRYNKYGSLLLNGLDCFLFPDANNSDWKTYIRKTIFKQGDVVIAICNDIKSIAVFSHEDERGNLFIYDICDSVTVKKVDQVKDLPRESELFYKRVSNRPGRHLVIKGE